MALKRIKRAAATPPPSTSQDSEFDPLKAMLAIGGATAAGIAARKPGLLKKAWETASALRQQAMLSGFAPLKSLLGNVGGTVINAAERRTMAPIKELFSKQTAQDIVAAYRNKTGHPSYGTNLPGPTPGRIMGALDTASQNALVRSGLPRDEAARIMMQAPLEGKLADVLESPAGRFLIPFRRTPFNQFFEGYEVLKNPAQHKAVLGAMTGAGAIHGAATADERYPTSIGLATAGAAKYGVPYALAALAGRTLAGGRSSSGIAAQTLPVSEYGIESSISDPLQPFQDPAILRALRSLRGR